MNGIKTMAGGADYLNNFLILDENENSSKMSMSLTKVQQHSLSFVSVSTVLSIYQFIIVRADSKVIDLLILIIIGQESTSKQFINKI